MVRVTLSPPSITPESISVIEWEGVDVLAELGSLVRDESMEGG